MERSTDGAGAYFFDKQNFDSAAIVNANANTRNKFAKHVLRKDARFNDVPSIVAVLCALCQ